jgi:tetratricopeptide (TPR) repeat protein
MKMRPPPSILIALLLCAITTLVFWEVPRQEFVAWDDNNLIYNNPYLNPVTIDKVAYLWRHPYLQLYMPLTYSAWAALANVARLSTPQEVSGVGYIDLNSHPFHIFNLVLHLLNVILVFILLRTLVGREWAAAAGALLFGVHPVQVESVAWVSELKGLLCGFFSLLALWQYLNFARLEVGTSASSTTSTRSKRLSYTMALVCFVLALLSKPSAVTCPLIAWALDYWMLKRPLRVTILSVCPWLVISLLWSILTRQAQPFGDYVVQPFWWRPFIMGDALAFYVAKLVWPAQLAIDYGRTPTWVIAQKWTYIIWLAPFVLAVWIWRGRQQRPWLVASGAILLAALLPVLGLIPFNFQQYSTVADRYLYLGMLGPALALAWFTAHIPQKQKVIMGLCLFVLGALGFRSAFQTLVWYNSLTLYENAVTVNPHSWVAQRNYADALAEEGRSDDAINHLNEALRLRPNYALAHTSMAKILAQRGELQSASEQLYEVLRLDPEDKVKTEAHNNIGAILMMQGKMKEATQQFQETLKLQPDNLVAHYNLGLILCTTGQTKLGLTHLRAAVQIDPYNVAAQKALAQFQQQRSK